MEKEFIENFKEALEITTKEISLADEFRSYEEWDSLAYLSVIAMLDEKYDLQIEEDEFKTLKTANDIFNKTKN